MLLPLGLLLLPAALVCAAPQLSMRNPKDVYTGPVRDGDFVKVDGTRLFVKDGPHYVTGFNYWACMNLAADDSTGGNYTRFISEMDIMAEYGVNHLRIMASSEGNPNGPQPFRMRPALLESPYHWNEDIFVGLDRCVAEAGKRGIRLTMTLNDEWHWSGGFSQYVSWVTDNGTIPYPPSWDLSLEPQPWGNYTTDGSFNDFTAFANRFYDLPEAQEIWQDHILKVINRVNTVNGKVYKDDATIMTWEVANEPQPVSQINIAGSLALVFNETDSVLSWIENSSKFIKKHAPKQLVTTGFEGKQGEEYFKAVHAFDSIDYACSHMWVQNWGVYDMLNTSAANLNNALEFARVFIANTSQWSLDLGKPVVLEEFGFPRDNWENVEAGEYLYSAKATTRNKDAYYSYVLGNVLNHWTYDKAYVGTMPWAFGGLWRPEPFVVNEFNMTWAGDPPHEAPGWYDVYSDDSVMDLVKEQTDNTTWLIEHGLGW